MKLLRSIWNVIRPKSQREIQEEWLAKSTDLADLERKVKLLDRMAVSNAYARGWL